MRIGVYVDGYNLYYAGRRHCGRGHGGWRWLDVRALAQDLISGHTAWQPRGAVLERLVYCTARVDGATNPSAHADQDVYLKALTATKSVDWIEYGNYVARTKKAILATEDPKTHRPLIVRSQWPLMVRDAKGGNVPDASFMISYLHMEEKGSDVNVASHLLIDVMTNAVDAAIVISNDSDLRLPVLEARKRVPVGTVNPAPGYPAGALRGQPTDGVGGHWWKQLTPGHFTRNQLPRPAGGFTPPIGW